MGGYTLNNMLEAAIVVRYQTLENYRNQKKTIYHKSENNKQTAKKLLSKIY